MDGCTSNTDNDLKGKILVVDDEADVTAIWERSLNRANYQVLSCNDPFEAIEIYQDNPDEIQLVILDYNMPGKSGIEVTNEIRDIRPDQKIMMISGIADTELRNQAEAAKLQCLLSKPVRIRELLQKAQEIIAQPCFV